MTTSAQLQFKANLAALNEDLLKNITIQLAIYIAGERTQINTRLQNNIKSHYDPTQSPRDKINQITRKVESALESYGELAKIAVLEIIENACQENL